jgi:hypothetical protein
MSTLPKESRSIKFNLFYTPIGISKKDTRNIGRLVRTEFMRTRQSPYESIFSIQQPVLDVPAELKGK